MEKFCKAIVVICASNYFDPSFKFGITNV